MDSVGKNAKIWILIALLFLLVWIVRLVPNSLERFYNIIFIDWNFYYREVVGGWMYSLATVGLISRFFGVIIGIATLFLSWKRKNLFEIRKWVATALFLESLYYLLLFPSPIWLLALGPTSNVYVTLAISYILQIIFTVPFLLLLAVKLFKTEVESFDKKVLKWAGVAFAAYIIALWSNSVLRWVDMILTEGIQFLFSGIISIGALNALVFMSFAVLFAIIGAYSLVRHKDTVRRWIALSLLMVGLHYTIFLVYSYMTNSLNSVWLVDIWTIPLIGLGLVTLKVKKTNSS